ncbi:MAG: hypothetical protein ACI8O8_002311 [Oleiphilaceae bacterium]|jgi:hypothetical protein
MRTKLFHLLIILPIFTLTACKTDIQPEWERYHTQAQNNESRVEWLSNIAVDVFGDIISSGSSVLIGGNRQQNILIVKQDSNGNLIWASEYDLAQGAYRSDDKVTDMVLDQDGNTYVVGVRYIVENEQQRYASFMIKFDRYGDLNWINELSEQEDARDIEIKNNLLYVTGFATQVFNLEGQAQLKIEHDKAWDIEVDDTGNFYITGATRAQKYTENGALIWSVNLPADLELRASLALNQDGSIVVAHNHDDRTSRVSGISSNGLIQWNKKYLPAKQSYGFPGPALVKIDWRGDILLSLSNDRGRRIVKLNDLGREEWQVTSTGIVQDFLIGDDGSVYAVGGGTNEKYDSSGKFIAATAQTSATQITTGSIALDGDDMFVGYSAVKDGEINLYLAKFIDK